MIQHFLLHSTECSCISFDSFTTDKFSVAAAVVSKWIIGCEWEDVWENTTEIELLRPTWKSKKKTTMEHLNYGITQVNETPLIITMILSYCSGVCMFSYFVFVFDAQFIVHMSNISVRCGHTHCLWPHLIERKMTKTTKKEHKWQWMDIISKRSSWLS